jgi:hypothetical protein
MANPVVPFVRRAQQMSIFPIAPPDIDANIAPNIYSAERNNQRTVDGWAVAIPMPYKYKWALSSPQTFSGVILFAQVVTLPDWTTVEPTHPGRLLEYPADTYFLPTAEAGGTPYTTASSARSWSGRITTAKSLTFGMSANLTDIVATFTMTGTGGYTQTITVKAEDQYSSTVSLAFEIPTPWDLDRTVTFTWTGGSASALVGGAPTIKTYAGIALTLDIPNGAVLNDTQWDGRRGASRTLSHMTGRPNPQSIREAHRLAGGFTRRKDVSGTDVIISYGTYGPTMDSCPTAGFLRTFGARWSDTDPGVAIPITPGSDEAKFMGIPFRRAGGMYTSTVTPCGYPYVRRVIDCWIVVYAFNSICNYRLVRASDWGTDYTGPTVIASISAGSSYLVDTWTQLTGIYPFGPESYIGNIQLESDEFGSWAPTNSAGYITFEDFTPVPIAIPTTDGLCVPATVVTASVVPAAVAQPVANSGLTFPFTAIPGGVELYYLQFTDVPRGFYFLRDNLGNDIGTIWGTSEISGGTPAVGASVTVETGDSVYAQPPAGWGSFKKGTYTGSPSPTSCVLTAFSPAHNALSVGDNDISSTYAKFGWPSLLAANRITMGMQSFTAPADGTYLFDLYSTFTSQGDSLQHGIWASTTDSLCLHLTPDAVEPSPATQSFNPGTAFVSSPPALPGSPSQVVYLINNGTGAFAGKTGYMVRGAYSGIPANPIAWKFYKLPIGYRGTSAGTIYYWDGSAWVQRNTSYASYQTFLSSGQTLYLRIANVRTAYGFYPRRGGPVSFGETLGLFKMRVTAV